MISTIACTILRRFLILYFKKSLLWQILKNIMAQGSYLKHF